MKKMCFVAMPFGTGEEYAGKNRESDFIFYDIIKPAVESAFAKFNQKKDVRHEYEPEVIRELEEGSPGDITISIIEHIAKSHITIVDLTGRNPNVFFELGVRHALRRNGTILIVQDKEQLPFDIRNFRIVEYDPRFDGINRSKVSLEKAVLRTLEILEEPSTSMTDSLVFQALADLQVSGPGFFEGVTASEGVSWEEYWSRAMQVNNILNQLLAAGWYEPDIIMGISNGGLFISDTVLRLVYASRVPIVCLWAYRLMENYFDNAVNNAIITKENLEEITKAKRNNRKDHKIRLLIMDDVVGTQRTFKQLISYLQSRLGEFYHQFDIRFVFLFCTQPEVQTDLESYLLSNHPDIKTSFHKFELNPITNKSALPYWKNIHSGEVWKKSLADENKNFAPLPLSK
jgi:hypoxanthine phosphoribosyltransferase